MKSFAEIYEFSRLMDGNGTEDHLLCTATAEELKAFIPHLMALPCGARIVELGTYTGRSTSVYFQLQKDLDLDIHLVDIWNWNPKFAIHTFSDMVVDHFNDTPFTYHKMPSALLASTWLLPIDFLYIDGAHESPLVNFDFDYWPVRVKSGGILAAHDSHYPDIIPCLENLADRGWELIAKVERLTVWRKPA